MKCPNCGKEMEIEIYRNMHNRKGSLQMCMYCENGDFGTDYTSPIKAHAEVESAYKWNRMSK